MLSPMLTFEQLRQAVTNAKQQFKLIQKKYPNLQAHLVLSLPQGQTTIDSSPLEILDEFPALIAAASVKSDALRLLAQLKSESTSAPENAQLKAQLAQLTSRFEYDGDCYVEIRFDDLKFDLVWKLQRDELVNRQLTPQTKASIQIVLGSLAQFTQAPERTTR